MVPDNLLITMGPALVSSPPRPGKWTAESRRHRRRRVRPPPRHQIQALAKRTGDVELFAIADPNADVRAKAKAHYGCKAVADWRELLGKVDLVSVCSPAVTHAEIVRAFLNAGAHVLVEKPIATTAGRSRRAGRPVAQHAAGC